MEMNDYREQSPEKIDLAERLIRFFEENDTYEKEHALERSKNEEEVLAESLRMLDSGLLMRALLDVMERQLDNNTLTVDELVEEMGMGRTVFFNKLKSMTGLSPVEFIREMRIKRAAQLLEERQYNITEVTYMVGMNDSRYFAKCFKNTYGVTPSEYRRAALERKGKTE